MIMTERLGYYLRIYVPYLNKKMIVLRNLLNNYLARYCKVIQRKEVIK